MAVQSGSAFLLPSSIAPALRGPAIDPAVGALAPTATGAGSIEETSVNLAGLLAIGGATLAAASSSRRRSSAVTRNFFGDSGPAFAPKIFDPATELGVQDPVGFWDPLGLSADKDEATFKRRRAVEIKHGRISMYACMGYMVPEYYKFPGFLSPSIGLAFKDVPNGLAALSKVPVLGWAQIAWFAGLIEATGFFQGIKNIGGRRDASQDGEPGNYGVGFPNFLGKVEDPEARKTKLGAELANGRLAMMAIMGMFFQDGLTGSAWGDWALYTASPLRAFESELGVQAPIGFWDPAGFAADGSAANFARRRQTELKHGRIAMLATMGYITPEVTGKFPGFLSPSAGLKYADIPNGLAAISKVPGAGWAQMIAYAAFCEASQDQSAGSKGAAGDFGWKVLTSSDSAEKTKKLAAELANGRLAMMAIIGMFFQDGLTGSAWGDWALYTASPLRSFAGLSGSSSRAGSEVTRNFFGDSGPAFAPKRFDPATELGVQDPVGFWDPLGLSADKDEATFKRRRAVEIKHGRISMYACMGYILPEYYKFPGFLSPSIGLAFKDVPNGLAALSKVPVLGWAQIAWFAGLIEATGFFQGIKNIGGRRDASQDGEPGNYGVGFPNFLGKVEDPEARKTKLGAELANGRLAMMAIMGMFFQDGLTGSAWGDWALYTASPLRAFESELGVQAPIGFWDPAGFAADGSAANFARRRQTELKHGRIAMLATMGYITPEVTGKFPGFLSPSAGLKYADIPNGLAAISKVPGAGWAQMIAYAAFCEASQDQSAGSKGAAGDFGWKVLTSSDSAEKTKKLAAELANGRLAMMAIIGMFFQDGLTGSAWGDWALYTASPLRAFESELGVQAPVGFWDPVGFTADGSTENFARRRQTELKHGRISMLATMGYITPEITGKFPGYLSPSAGLKFTDVPNGLAALSKVPALGWAQILAYMAFVEVAQDQSAGTVAAKGDFGWKVLTSSDPEEKTKKLAAELANGRLSMMAIIGMFFQDGLTGSAWGDWASYTASPLR